jgi:hypothetical protein
MDQMILCAMAMMALRWWTIVAFYRPIGVLHEGVNRCNRLSALPTKIVTVLSRC